MTESIRMSPNTGSALNAANALRHTPQSFDTVFRQTIQHGYVGDGQLVLPLPEEAAIERLDEMLSAFGGSDNIWEIVLRLEEKPDIKAFSESFFSDPDNAAGRSAAEALLTQLWKKKELSGESAARPDAPAYIRQARSGGSRQEHIDSKAASELESLILRNKKPCA